MDPRTATALQELQDRQQQVENQPPSSPAPPSDPPSPPPASGVGGQVAQAALEQLGDPYDFGAAGPSSFDCSGLTMYAWGTVGVSIPHSATAQYTSLPKVDLGSVVPGDIIYYGNVGPHVAIYIGGGQIVHARHPGPGGEVQTDSMYGYDKPWAAMRPG